MAAPMIPPADAPAFLAANGWSGAEIRPLAGDASFRRYFRVHRPDGATAVLMDAPPAHEDVGPFLAVAGHLLDRGFSPPRPLAVDREKGLQLLAVLDERLRQSANLCGPSMSLADAAILPFVRQYAQVDRVWFDGIPLPALKSWLARHLASPLFQRIAVRLKPWSPGDADIRFPE